MECTLDVSPPEIGSVLSPRAFDLNRILEAHSSFLQAWPSAPHKRPPQAVWHLPSTPCLLHYKHVQRRLSAEAYTALTTVALPGSAGRLCGCRLVARCHVWRSVSSAAPALQAEGGKGLPAARSEMSRACQVVWMLGCEFELDNSSQGTDVMWCVWHETPIGF